MTADLHSDPLISDAIHEVWRTHPYYATAVTKLRIVRDDANVPTMATSKDWVTHYNGETLKSWTASERAAVLVHELEHLLRRHSERCGEREPGGWNVAGDAEINQRLPGLPDGAVYPETLGMPRGSVAEVYYAATQKARQQQQTGDGKPGQPGDGEPQPGGAGEPQPGKCGSAAGGPTQPHEAKDARNPGDGAKDGGKSVRREVAEAVMATAYSNEDAAELRDWAESELNIDRSAWYSALAAAVGHVMSPYGAPTRWVWPGRRDIRDMGGAMLPRWTGERPSCAVVIDTSGSITPMDLDMARAAGHYIARMADATFYGCNTRVTAYGPQMPDKIVGGGGTDLTVGIARAIADGARAVVVITDCDTPWPSEQTPVPVIIGANPSSRHVRQWVPDWMTILPIRADGWDD